MQAIQDYLVEKQNQFAQHSLFRRLLKEQSLEEFASLSAHLSFWVMSFQDLLRLNEERITNIEIRNIVRQHRLEDIGHEQWFLKDMNQMKCPVINLRSLYSHNHATTREATYALMSEVFQAHNDYERIALLLALESAGHVFFGFTVDFVENLGYSTSLLYFSHHHLEREQDHEIFEQKIAEYIANIQLSHKEKQDILNIIDRVYNAFTLMFDGLQIVIDSNIKSRKLPRLALV